MSLRLALLFALAGCAHRGASVAFSARLVDPSRLDVRGAEAEWAPAASPQPLPMSVWVRVGDHVAYTYLDLEMGPSAAWLDEGGFHARRLSHAPAAMVVLGDAERRDLGLPARPDWLEGYGPQAPPGTFWGGWRTDPLLAGRFHPEYPDDLRVVVGTTEGEQLFYEIVWVSLRRCDDAGCQGTLLNQPDRVPIAMGSQVHFRFADLTEVGLPPAAPVGSAPDAALVALARSSQLGDQRQDDPAWEVDASAPPEQRLVPMSQWVTVGGQLAFVALGPAGPEALVFGGDRVENQSLTWRPRGMRALTPAEIEELKLPATPLADATGQPPPGDWGAWRLDPRLATALRQDDPDVIYAQLVSAGSEVAEVVGVRLFACDKDTCRGRLVGDPKQSRLRAGDEVSVSLEMAAGGWPIVLDVSGLAPEE